MGRIRSIVSVVKPPLFRVATLIAALTTACAGPSVLVVGESVREPGPPLPELMVLAVSADDGSVIDDAVISFNGENAAAGSTAATTWYERSIPEDEAPVVLSLKPVVLTGFVRTSAGVPVQGAQVALNGATTTTGTDGAYRLVRATEGLITVRRAAWEPESREWTGSSAAEAFVLEPKMIRALRVSPQNAGTPAVWADFLEMAAESEVNAFVLDTKGESGVVPYEINSPVAQSIGAISPKYDVESALADMKAADLYAITRIVTFQDTIAAPAFPEWATTDSSTGELWRTNAGARWMDPTDRRSWEYPLELAVEACKLGFDEIQFDYVRFPSDGPIDRIVMDEGRGVDVRVATIAGFLGEARNRLNPLGCAVAADVFAITISAPGDEGIGQRPEELSQVVDVLSPMIYPTHYGRGWGGYDNPNDHPSEIVGGALDSGLPRLQGSAIMRPWLQTSTYGATEVGLEVAEADARELGWMLWTSLNIFDPRELEG